MKTKLVALLVAGVTLLLIGTATSGRAGALLATGAIPGPPIEQARAISGKADVDLVAPVRATFYQDEPLFAYVDSKSGDEYWVEKESGKVWRYRNAGAGDIDGRQDAGRDYVTARAHEHAVRSYNPSRLPGMVRSVERIGRGASGEHYVVTYREYVKGVPTFNMIEMEFLPDGTLLTCLTRDEDVAISLEPKLSADQAVRALAEEAGLKRWADQSEGLVAVMRGPHDQHLCWEIELRVGDETLGWSAAGLVDAHTGQVLDWGTTD